MQSVGGTLLAAEARIPPLLKRETAQQLLLNSCWAVHIEACGYARRCRLCITRHAPQITNYLNSTGRPSY